MGPPRPAPFSPLTDGFRFTNSWPPAPAISFRTPFGSIGIGNAAAGLCGGMVFAALDYWHALKPVPVSRPAPDTQLYRFIVRRLIDSWHVPAGVAGYYWRMNLPDGDSPLTVLGRPLISRPLVSRPPAGRRGLSRRTIEQEWPRVKDRLDRGVPVPLGLVTVASVSPGQLGRNHQVLACGYRLAGQRVTVEVYDPNSGQDDGVHIQFGTSGPAGAATFRHNINIGWPVRGFFRIAYSPVTPP